MSRRNFPNFVNAFMEYTRELETPEKFLKWGAYSIIAGALGRKTWVRVKRKSIVYPNMYVLLVGPAGLARKSTSGEAAYDLLAQVRGLNFLSTQVTQASLVKQMERAGESMVELGGKNYKSSQLYIFSSEAAVTLKEISGSVTELLTNFYDCSPKGWHLNHCWTKETVTGGKIRVFNPCINMFICSTPAWFVDSIGVKEITGGFASRMLFVVHSGTIEREVEWTDDMEHSSNHARDEDLKNRLIEDLETISQIKGQFQTEPGYRSAFMTFEKMNKQFIIDNPDSRFLGYYARKPFHIIKLSQVLAINENDNLLLKTHHFTEAKHIINELEKTMPAAFGAVGESEIAGKVHKLFSYLRARKEDTHTFHELTGHFWRDIDPKFLPSCINVLLSAGKIEKIAADGENAVYKLIDDSDLA